MGTQLWLQEARQVVREPGVGLFFDCSAPRADLVRQLLAQGALETANVWYDPVAGHFLARPDLTLTSHEPTAWHGADSGSWAVAQTQLTPSGEPVGYLAHQAALPWSLTEVAPARAGQGRFLSFLAYETRRAAGGYGTDSPLVVELGGVWRLALHASGEATLDRRVTQPGSGEPATEPVATFDWLAGGRFAEPGGSPHHLWVYEAGGRLVIRRLGAAAGVVVDSGVAPGAPVLARAPWRLSGGGCVALNVSDQRFGLAACRVAGPLVRLTTPSTRRCRARLHGASIGVAPATVTVRDEHGLAWPVGDGGGLPPREALRWEVTWTAAAAATACLSAVSVALPGAVASDGCLGTDLLALPGVSDQAIRVTRRDDPPRDTLDATVTALEVDLAALAQPHLSVRLVVDDVTRFRGLTARADWTVLAGTTPPTGRFRLLADGLERRFEKTVWPGGEPFDGRLLTDCLAEVLAAAGLTPADWDLAAVDLRLPTPPPGEAPSLVYRPGTPLAVLLADLRAKWYGVALEHGFRVSDGQFQLVRLTSAEPVATFHTSSAAAAAAGTPGRTVRAGTYRETLDDGELYNAVAVLGQASDGRPLLARAIDWGSLQDPAAFNYVGEAWWLLVSDPGLRTPGAVNRVCAGLFARHRLPRVLAEWVSEPVEASGGDLVAIVEGESTWRYRLRAVTLERTAAEPGRASYLAEKVL